MIVLVTLQITVKAGGPSLLNLPYVEGRVVQAHYALKLFRVQKYKPDNNSERQQKRGIIPVIFTALTKSLSYIQVFTALKFAH
jgi:rRNA maturation protein Rpf1